MNKEKHKTAGRFSYSPNDMLGSGTWGAVYLARSLTPGDNQLYALKKINKFKIEATESSFQKYKSEVLTLQKGNNIKQVIKFVDCFKSKSSYYIITEYVPGSVDMYSYLQEKKRPFTEMEARDIWVSLLQGIESLHKLKIIHRDLKMQNILYIPEKRMIKIIDFGLATTFQQFVQGRVGSPLFMSPQVIKSENYTERCDIWSLGIVFYCMICGVSPFGFNPSISHILDVMTVLDANQPLPLPKGVFMTPPCEQVIKSCLKWDEFDRMSVGELLKLNFFKEPNISRFKTCLDYFQPELSFVN